MRLQKIGLIAAMSGLVGGVIAVAAVQLTDTGGSSNSTAAVVATASPAADSRQQASLSSGDSLSAADPGQCHDCSKSHSAPVFPERAR